MARLCILPSCRYIRNIVYRKLYAVCRPVECALSTRLPVPGLRSLRSFQTNRSSMICGERSTRLRRRRRALLQPVSCCGNDRIEPLCCGFVVIVGCKLEDGTCRRCFPEGALRRRRRLLDEVSEHGSLM